MDFSNKNSKTTRPEAASGNLLSEVPLTPSREGEVGTSSIVTPLTSSQAGEVGTSSTVTPLTSSRKGEVGTASTVTPLVTKPGVGTPVPIPAKSSDTSDGFIPVMGKKQKKNLRKKQAQAAKRLRCPAPQSPKAPPALQTVSEPKVAPKRQRSLGSTPGTTQRPPQKIRKVHGPTFAGAAKTTLSMYVGPTMGDVPLTLEEFWNIKRALQLKVLDRARKSPEWPVQVESCTHHQGRVRVICSDERSLGWVKEEAGKLVPPPGSRKGYWVMGPSDLPPTKKCTAWVPLDVARGKKDLLQLLEASNTGLRIAGLHLIRETPPSGQGHLRGRICVFAVEEDTFQRLEALQMRPFCGMGRMEFRHRAPGAPPPPPTASAAGERGVASGMPSPSASADASAAAEEPTAPEDLDDPSNSTPAGSMPMEVVGGEPGPSGLNLTPGP